MDAIKRYFHFLVLKSYFFVLKTAENIYVNIKVLISTLCLSFVELNYGMNMIKGEFKYISQSTLIFCWANANNVYIKL